MTTSPQGLDPVTQVLDLTPHVLDPRAPLPDGPLVAALTYDEVVHAMLCDPVVEAEHDVDARAAGPTARLAPAAA
ncbi:hypothetical protein [Micromonospora haikouensis]|uniref:hypothetical protein n=1 Tax=Micromonospora haikouensis TaxID=686309 RepID=UPI003D761CA6